MAGLRYLIVLVVLGAVGFGVYRLAFSGETNEPAADELSPLPTDPFVTESPSVEPTVDESASPTPEPVTGRVQVLDGSSSAERLAAAESKLEEAGYEVVATGSTSKPYDLTTILYQPDNQQMGEAVASLLGASLVQQPNSDQVVDTSIPVTVVIGPDFAG